MGGVWAWLHLAGFFLLLRTVGAKQLTLLLHIATAAGIGASLHAIVEHFSKEDSLTIAGNSGLFAGYLLVGLAIPIYLAMQNAKYRLVYLVGAALELTALVIAQNRSSVLGLIAGGVVAALLLTLGAEHRRRRWIPLAVAGGFVAAIAALIAIVSTVGTARVPAGMPAVVRRIAETDFAGLDALRTFQWEAALAGFRERPVLGFGPENHHLVWAAHFDPRSEEIGMDVFDRAHNQYLEILSTAGIVGTLAFLAIWAAIGYSLYRAFSARRLNVGELAVLAGGNVAYATYLVFWFVDISAAIVWMLLNALIAARSIPLPVVRESSRRLSRPFAFAGVVLTGAVLAFILHRHAYVPLRASIALAALDSYSGNEDPPIAAVETIAASAAHQTSHFGPVLSRFVQTWRRDIGDETIGSTAESEELNRAFQAAISAFDAELGRDPLNDRLHTAAAQLQIEAAAFYDSPKYLARAITLLAKAVELNPGRSRQRRLLAETRADFSADGAGSGN
jgi:O-antigen ligase